MFVFQYLLSFWTYSCDWEIDVILYSVFVPCVILYQIFSCLSWPSWFSILMAANCSAKWLQHHLLIHSSCFGHLGDSRLFIKTNYPPVNTCMHACIHPPNGWNIKWSPCSFQRVQKRNANVKSPLRNPECGLHLEARTVN